MPAFELNRKRTLDESHWPLGGFHADLAIDLELSDPDIPVQAQRRLALQALRRMLREAELEAFEEGDSGEVALEAPRPAEPEPAEEEPQEEEWVKPEELDLRVIKSAHRLLMGIAKHTHTGRPVMASDLVGSIGLSAPTMGRLLRDGEPGYEYLKPFIEVKQEGRTKALKLSPEGKELVAKIGAGEAPR